MPDGTAPYEPTLTPGDATTELGTLPDYQILRVLGRGGMGAVYLARNTLSGREHALKVIRPEFLASPGAEGRFRREIEAACALDHPNIVRALTAFRHGGSLILALEYVEGRDLAAEVAARAAPMPVEHACSYAGQAALGLQHAHDKGLVHRDVKPSNLMLTRAGGKRVVKVMDFGLVKAATGDPAPGLTGRGEFMGTPDYLAPEQARDAANVDGRADVYGLGCTLYFLLARQPPFPTGSALERMMAHASREPTPLRELRPEVPEELAAIVAKMMAKNPADRFQTPREVVKVLAPFTRAGGVTASGPRPTVAPPRRRRGRLVAGAALLAAGIGVGAWLLADRAPAPAGPPALVAAAEPPPAAPPTTPAPRPSPLAEPSKTQAAEPAAPPAGPAPRKASPNFTGEWRIAGDELMQVKTEPANRPNTLLFGRPEWTDYIFTAEMRLLTLRGPEPRQCRIVYRGSDPGRLSTAFVERRDGKPGLTAESWDVTRWVQRRAFAHLSATPVTVGTVWEWQTISVRVQGAHCAIRVNGKPAGNYVGVPQTSGMVGVSTINAAASFRNFRVASLDGEVFWTGLPELP